MIFSRTLQLPQLLQQKSIFLFGPRATGKTFLINQQLPHSLVINLLHGEVFVQLGTHPSLLEAMISAASANNPVVIDEVQRIPTLLN